MQECEPLQEADCERQQIVIVALGSAGANAAMSLDLKGHMREPFMSLLHLLELSQ
jgi:hypothetical protein